MSYYELGFGTGDRNSRDYGPPEVLTGSKRHGWLEERQEIRDRWGPETEDDIIAQRVEEEERLDELIYDA